MGIFDRNELGVIQSPFAPSGGGGGGITWSTPVDSSITADTTGVYDFGSSSERFKDIYAQGVDLTAASAYLYIDNTAGEYAQIYTQITAASAGGTFNVNNALEFSGPSAIYTFDGSALEIFTRNGGSGSGALYLGTANSGANNSGDTIIRTGTSSATRGKIKLVNGSEGTIGHVWTSTGTDGSGGWAAASSASPGSTNGAVQFNNSGAFGGNAASLFWDNTNGRLGIGTSSPSTALQITTADAPYSVIVTNTTGGALLTLNSADSVQVLLNAQSGSASVGTETSDNFNLRSNASNRVRIASSGVVSILAGNELRLEGSSSGYVGLVSPAAPTSVTYTLPTADGSSGNFLSTNGSGVLSWAAAPSATPAGTNGQVQFNNSGAFGAESNLFWDATNNRLGIGTSSPTVSLMVSVPSPGGAGIRLYQPDGNGVYHYVESQGQGTAIIGAQGGVIIFGAESNHSVDIKSNNTTRIAIAASGRITFNSETRMFNSGSDPSGPTAGVVFYDTGLNKLKVYNGTTWETITST